MTHFVLEKIAKQSPHLEWIKDNTLYLVLHGSKSYNCHTEASDDDFKGVAVPSKKYFTGFLHNFDQAELKDPDACIFGVKKFFNLIASTANPNLLEILNVRPEHQLIVHPLFEEVLNNKDKFLSKRIRYSFGGFAFDQMRRLKLHKRWLNADVKKPERKDFDLAEKPEIDDANLKVAKAMIRKEMDKFNWNFLEDFSGDQRTATKNIVNEMLAEMSILSKDDLFLKCSKKIGFDENMTLLLQKEHRFETAMEDFRKYNEWKKNRNPIRYVDEVKYGYDCYVEETEFLTDQGWKKFDDIDATIKLATVFVKPDLNQSLDNRPDHLAVEYQNYTERFDGTFTGNLYDLKAFCTHVRTTPNHRMLIKEVERNDPTKVYPLEWVEAADLYDTFAIVNSINPLKKNYSYEDIYDFKALPIKSTEFMSLMGWYLSDGCMSWADAEKTKPNILNISQIKDGKLYKLMYNFYEKYKQIGVSIKEYVRQPNDFNPKEHIETVLKIYNKKIIEEIYKACGATKEKRIPRWVFKCSKQLMDYLLDGLMKGDGTSAQTKNGFNYRVYYASLEKLADDVQELAFMCGYTTTKNGPYVGGRTIGDKKYVANMFQIRVNEDIKQFKKCIRYKNITKIPVENKRIVCFTVPNSTLITRLNGKIAIHGNSKFAYHVYRLYSTAIEALETGKLNVYREDRDTIMDIRNGKWSFEKLEEFSQQANEKLNYLYDNSMALPYSIDKVYIDNLCQKIVEKFL